MATFFDKDPDFKYLGFYELYIIQHQSLCPILFFVYVYSALEMYKCKSQPFIAPRIAKVRRQTIISVDKNVEKPSHVAGGNVKGTTSLENNLSVPQNVKHDSAFLLLGGYRRELKIYVHMQTCTQIFIAVLFIIAKKEK